MLFLFIRGVGRATARHPHCADCTGSLGLLHWIATPQPVLVHCPFVERVALYIIVVTMRTTRC